MPPLPPPRAMWIAYLELLFAVLLVTASEIFMKKGAVSAAAPEGGINWTAQALFSPWIWAAIVLYALSFVFWLSVLRSVKLSAAFNMSQLDHALVPLAAWIILGENISPLRWTGIGLVVAGVSVIASRGERSRDGAA